MSDGADGTAGAVETGVPAKLSEKERPSLMCPYIVCGWYTPDYAPWASKLIRSLDRIGAPHDIIKVPAMPGSWEENTMRKPGEILAAMDRHPGKTIIFLDVDCEVLGRLDPLAEIDGDVGFYVRTKYRRSGGMYYLARSGTVVVRPTAGARQYVMAWIRAARDAPWRDVDQTAQMVAMGRAPGTTFTILGPEWCAIENDRVREPVILHDSASRGIRKATRTQRRLHHWWQVLSRHLIPLRAIRG